jgi:hypothetical protein
MNDLLPQLTGALVLVSGAAVLGFFKLLARPADPPSVLGPALGFGGTTVALAVANAPAPAWLALTVLAALTLGGRLLLSPRVAPTCASALAALGRPRIQGAVLLILAPLLGLAWLGRLPTELPDDLPEDPQAAKLSHVFKVRPLPDLAFATDRGRRIPAYQPVLDGWDPAEFPALEAMFLQRGHRLAEVIRRAGPDPAANCHGWTFTGGRCWIRTEEAELILRDNGYYAASEPQAGDLVTYRQEDGTLAHSGVVAAVLEDRTVLVESKWGWAGRYLHPVEAQPYSDQWEYFRSPRVGHLLCGTFAPETHGALTQTHSP